MIGWGLAICWARWARSRRRRAIILATGPLPPRPLLRQPLLQLQLCLQQKLRI